MRNILLFPFLILLAVVNISAVKINQDENVYICDSKYAKRFHLNPTCRGLNNCKHEIVKMTKKEALEKGRDLCHLEY